MPDINQYVFEEEIAVNAAVDELLTYSRAMTDDKAQPLFVGCERGWAYPESEPRYDEVPQLRIWHANHDAKVDNIQFDLAEEDIELSLFFYFYAFDGSDIQAQREKFVRHFLKKLRVPQEDEETVVNVGLVPVNFQFVTDTIVRIDHTSAFRKIADFIQLPPHPWYVTRVDITIRITNYDQEN